MFDQEGPVFRLVRYVLSFYWLFWELLGLSRVCVCAFISVRDLLVCVQCGGGLDGVILRG